MEKIRFSLLTELDRRAKKFAVTFDETGLITDNILKTIIEMYSSAKVERLMMDEFFEAAYHTPITGELEFLLARILYHYSLIRDLGWKIFLRRQESKVAPDIRILKNGRDISIIEVKAKAGWIQPFLSLERYNNDKLKMSKGNVFDPDVLIQAKKGQLTKYHKVFNLKPDDVFFLLPTMAHVHRKKYVAKLSDYHNYFKSTSGLPKENLILLSSNLTLDLSKPGKNAFAVTDYLEQMIRKIEINSARFVE